MNEPTIESLIAQNAALVEENRRLVDILLNWRQLALDAREPKSHSNTAFVDVRDLRAFQAETEHALQRNSRP
jgi:hypothetical protein